VSEYGQGTIRDVPRNAGAFIFVPLPP
jgi:hypothetical protein